MRMCKRKMWKIGGGALAFLLLLTVSVIICGGSVQAAGRPVTIRSCLIAGGDVLCNVTAGSVPSSDDGKYYIYANEVFEDGPVGDVVATVEAGSDVTASFPEIGRASGRERVSS